MREREEHERGKEEERAKSREREQERETSRDGDWGKDKEKERGKGRDKLREKTRDIERERERELRSSEGERDRDKKRRRKEDDASRDDVKVKEPDNDEDREEEQKRLTDEIDKRRRRVGLLQVYADVVSSPKNVKRTWTLEGEDSDDDDEDALLPKSGGADTARIAAVENGNLIMSELNGNGSGDPDAKLAKLIPKREDSAEKIAAPFRTVQVEEEVEKEEDIDPLVAFMNSIAIPEVINVDSVQSVAPEPKPAVVNQGSKREQEVKKLALVDHSKIQYPSFRKDFYIEVKEISRTTKEEAEAYRKELELKFRGKDIPRPLKSWNQTGLNSKVLDAIKKLGFEKPMSIQTQALPFIMSGRDCIGIAKTGSGETLAFVLPMLRHIMDQPPLQQGDGPIGLIMVPTGELVQQIYNVIRKFSKIGCLTWVSNLRYLALSRILDQIDRLCSFQLLFLGGRSVVNSDITQTVEVRPDSEQFLRLLELLGK
uniref:RNA helicase n=1 Tax=Physcomitrium patens TaxID=3218 RepID=A0A7I4FQD3_PHYPA